MVWTKESTFHWLQFALKSLRWYSYRKEFAPSWEQILSCKSAIPNQRNEEGADYQGHPIPFHSILIHVLKHGPYSGPYSAISFMKEKKLHEIDKNLSLYH